MNTNGGITYSEAYHMPVAYRIITVKKLSDLIKKQNEDIEKASKKGTSLTMSDLSKRAEELPDFVSQRAATK